MKSISLENQPIYTKQLVNKKINVPFAQLSGSVEKIFKDYADKFIVGKCSKEGYISSNHVKVINYSAPKCVSSYATYDVLYELNVYNPYEGQELYAKVSNITKIGIKAVISSNNRNNPITVFASRLHNEDIIMKDDSIEFAQETNSSNHIYGENDIIKIQVIGHRFEVNDSSIYILGRIIENKNE
uniref:S1 motif domain-containing protein n=1 Tax=viral metagenome TaxID=1070528 RepID=A0A6C0KXV3_9ZZZZ|tara:strand:+ start:14933 stop:15487 length:555 start_codon:yes stop_codon:yes gene_type:complete